MRSRDSAAGRSVPAARRRILLAGCLVLAAVVACSDGEGPGRTDPSGSLQEPSGSPAATDQWTRPGLVDQYGDPYEVEEPREPSGDVLDVTSFGADPRPGSPDDAKAVRRALQSAESGDSVVLPEGTYDLRSVDPEDETAHLVLRTGVHLRGAGPGRTVLVSSFDGHDDSVVLLGEGVEDVVVSGLTVTSTHDGELGSDPESEDKGGGPMFGIKVGERDGVGSARVLIEDVAVERFQRHGISLKATREVTVRGCLVSDATSVGPGGSGYGIAAEGRADQRDPAAANDSRHNVVIGNTLHGEHLRHAILLQFPTHNNLVADNRVDGSVLDAIDLHGEGEYLNEIRDNTVVDGQRAAIALGNSGGDTHGHAASGEGNWVHDNDLVGNREGILVILGTPRTVVERNSITPGPDSEVGIELSDAPGTVLEDNEIGETDGFVPVRVDGEER